MAVLNLGLCSVIVGDFVMYLGGILSDHPGIITVYIAYHPQKLCPEISALLQISSTPSFSFDKLDFLYIPTYFRPGSNVFYTVRFCNEITALRIAIVNSSKPCGPRSNINFTYYMWETFAYPIKNHGMVVLPLRTSGVQILYTLSYKAEIGGDNSRTCKMCICNIRDLRTLYSFSCKKPGPFSCIICCKQPISLKTAAFKTVLSACNIGISLPGGIQCLKPRC